MRQVRQIMGIPVTVDIPGCEDKVVFDLVFARLHEIDSRFSTYKPDSEVSRFARGELSEAELSAELTDVIKQCRRAEKWTDGYFSAWAAGAFDPSGYVKGWAIGEAGKVIEKKGIKTYCISAGGDILARSRLTRHALSKSSKARLNSKRSWRHTQFFPSVLVQRTTRTLHSVPREEIASDAQASDPRRRQNEYEKIWQVGIQDPRDKSKILNPISNLDVPQSDYRLLHSGFATGQASLEISNGAVCTSGTYERGGHIINPKTKKPANELLSVTVTGPDIIKADILATACFAMGTKATEFMKSQKGHQALIIDKNKLK